MALYKHIPNTITSMNLLAGIMGVIFALEGRLEWALPLMVLAAVFDFCDGLAVVDADFLQARISLFIRVREGGNRKAQNGHGHHKGQDH